MSQQHDTAKNSTGAHRKRAFEEFAAGMNDSKDAKSLDDHPQPTRDDERPRKETVAVSACWLCQIFKKKCDSRDVCHECQIVDDIDGRGILGCRRDNLQDHLDDMSAEFPGLGTEKWLLPAVGKLRLKIHLRWANRDLEIRDLDLRTVMEQHDPYRAVIPFLRQFHTLNTRWNGTYEPFTEELITSFAVAQENKILEFRRRRKPLIEEDLLMMSTLRALNLSYYIADVSSNMPLFHMSEKEFEATMYLQSQVVTLGLQQNPSIEISRYDPSSDADPGLEIANGTKLRTIIHDVVRLTHRMLLRGRPADLPTLLGVLCVLKIVISNIYIVPNINFAGQYELEDIWEILCGIFFLTSQGLHPLTDTWDSVAFEALAGKNSIAYVQMKALNDLWVLDDFEGEYSDCEFSQRVDHFINAS